MPRLTKKDYDGMLFWYRSKAGWAMKEIDKLGRYEDVDPRPNYLRKMKKEYLKYKEIEKELGIDALLYLRVMSHQVVYIKGKEPEWGGVGDESEIESYHVMRFTKDRLEVRFAYSDTYTNHVIENPLNSYGKVWAVTKEELE